jgi:hypothetical protein
MTEAPKKGRWGFYLYNGFPESGKTWKARARAQERARETGAPLLVIMRERDDDNFKDLHEAKSIEEACRRVWTEGLHTRFKAASPVEVNQLCGVALDQRFAVLVVDGIWDCLKAPSVQPNVNEIVRAGRHYDLDLHGTSQVLGDFAKVAKSCALEVYQFLETDADDLLQLQKRFGFDPDLVRSLPQRQSLFWSRTEIWKRNLALQRKKSKTPPPAAPPPKSSK